MTSGERLLTEPVCVYVALQGAIPVGVWKREVKPGKAHDPSSYLQPAFYTRAKSKGLDPSVRLLKRA